MSVNRGNIFKSRLVSLIILVVCLFLIVNLTRSVWQLWQAGDKVKEEEEKVTETELKNEELKKKLSEVQSPKYLEKIARDKLGLAKEGEVVVVLPSPQPTTSRQVNDENLPNWKRWWRLFF